MTRRIRWRARAGRWTCAALGGMFFAVGCGDFSIFSEGRPTWEALTEDFEQRPLSKRDILWVIDNTGSMRDELEQLAPLFDTFISDLNTYDISYQVGIVTTDVETMGGILQGMPWIITPETENAADIFSANVLEIRESPSSVATEEGLEAVRLAFSPDMIAPDGPNYGFFRDDAGLSVVVVSDSDDSSVPPEEGVDDVVSYYADQLIAFKGGDDAAHIVFSAIVALGEPGDEQGCRNALFGQRYVELAAMLNGTAESICADDLSMVVASLGASQVVRRRVFELSHVPIEGSVVVWVNDVLADEGDEWSLDLQTPAIEFVDGAEPPSGSSIRVAYRYYPQS